MHIAKKDKSEMKERKISSGLSLTSQLTTPLQKKWNHIFLNHVLFWLEDIWFQHTTLIQKIQNKLHNVHECSQESWKINIKC